MGLATKNLPFEYIDRWAQIGHLFVPKAEGLSSETLTILDKRDKDLEDHLANLAQGGQTFQHFGALTATESDIYWVPDAKSTRLLVGGVTVYGSGTVTATLNKGGVQMGAALSITGTGVFTAAIGATWAAGDAMTVEVTATGTGCSGLVVQEIA